MRLAENPQVIILVIKQFLQSAEMRSRETQEITIPQKVSVTVSYRVDEL